MATDGENDNINIPENKQQNANMARIAGLAKARAIKAAKAEAKKLRESRNRIKNLWSVEEEQALLTAIETVGPHWALIMKYYGSNGSIDQSLKKRNAKQLYHKATRIKAHMMMEGKRIPTYMEEIPALKLKRSYSVGTEDEDEDFDKDEDDEEVLPVSKRARRSAPAKNENQRFNGTTELDEDGSGFAGVEHEATLPKPTSMPFETRRQSDNGTHHADLDENRHTIAGFDESTLLSPSINQQTESDVDGEDELMMEMQLNAARAKREEARAKREEAELELQLAILKRRNRGRR